MVLSSVLSFVVPTRRAPCFDDGRARVCVLIPTYAPDAVTERLVRDLVRYNPATEIYVIDDSTPQERFESVRVFKAIAALSPQVTLLRTPHNALKAGALNYGLRRVFQDLPFSLPDVICTVDDDVVIAPSTIPNLVRELMSSENLAAVCSQCRVVNKNSNLLTRLQGLEYLGFNAIRLADEGFLQGPLVMHGMLTAFRASAVLQVHGFTEGHLIEDYDITTRLKALGWSVKAAQDAPAWTVVPESLAMLWRQRTRWSYGGLTVVAKARRLSAVFQDILGHLLFLTTFLLVIALLFLQGNTHAPSNIAQWIVELSLVQLGIWYVFQLWLMRFYEEKDRYDWMLRIALVPEFVYSYMMTTALFGSYAFFLFNLLKRVVAKRGGRMIAHAVKGGSRFFSACGYMEKRWGTRATP